MELKPIQKQFKLLVPGYLCDFSKPLLVFFTNKTKHLNNLVNVMLHFPSNTLTYACL